MNEITFNNKILRAARTAVYDKSSYALAVIALKEVFNRNNKNITKIVKDLSVAFEESNEVELYEVVIDSILATTYRSIMFETEPKMADISKPFRILPNHYVTFDDSTILFSVTFDTFVDGVEITPPFDEAVNLYKNYLFDHGNLAAQIEDEKANIVLHVALAKDIAGDMEPSRQEKAEAAEKPLTVKEMVEASKAKLAKEEEEEDDKTNDSTITIEVDNVITPVTFTKDEIEESVNIGDSEIVSKLETKVEVGSVVTTLTGDNSVTTMSVPDAEKEATFEALQDMAKKFGSENEKLEETFKTLDEKIPKQVKQKVKLPKLENASISGHFEDTQPIPQKVEMEVVLTSDDCEEINAEEQTLLEEHGEVVLEEEFEIKPSAKSTTLNEITSEIPDFFANEEGDDRKFTIEVFDGNYADIPAGGEILHKGDGYKLYEGNVFGGKMGYSICEPEQVWNPYSISVEACDTLPIKEELKTQHERDVENHNKGEKFISMEPTVETPAISAEQASTIKSIYGYTGPKDTTPKDTVKVKPSTTDVEEAIEDNKLKDANASIRSLYGI